MPTSPQRHAALTGREREVLELVVTGMLNKQIAAALGIAEKTIKVHRARVMDKMQAASVAELVRLAEKLGIGGARRERVMRLACALPAVGPKSKTSSGACRYVRCNCRRLITGSELVDHYATHLAHGLCDGRAQRVRLHAHRGCVHARAQDIEPRVYSNAPIGVNFLIAGYVYTRGGLAFDASLPVKIRTSKRPARCSLTHGRSTCGASPASSTPSCPTPGCPERRGGLRGRD